MSGSARDSSLAARRLAHGRRSRRLLAATARLGGRLSVLLITLMAAGCGPNKVVYHTRPSYYKLASKDPLPDQFVDDEGVLHIYRERGQEIDGRGRAKSAGKSDTFQMRETNEDGEIVLRAILPHHVVANALNCFRNQEYELLWDQLVSEQTKLAWSEQGLKKADFAAWCQQHRVSVAQTLTRMSLGLSSGETVVEPRNGFIVCRFWPHVAQEFKFKEVWIAREGLWLTLFAIR